MCVGFRCRARIIIPLFFLFPDGRGLNKGKSFLVAAFVVHADFIQVHAFVFVLLGESDFDFIVWGVERSGFSIVRAKTAEVVCL